MQIVKKGGEMYTAGGPIQLWNRMTTFKKVYKYLILL